MASTGFGITITFDSGFFAQIRNVDGPEMSRSKIDTSHAGTTGGYRTFIFSDLIDNGEMTVTGIADPGASPAIDGDLEAVTLSFPDGETWQFQGGLINYKITAPYDDLMTFTATLVASGEITITG